VNAELCKHHLPSLNSGLSLLRTYGGKTLDLAAREDLLMKVGQGSVRASSLLDGLDAFRKHSFFPQNPVDAASQVPGGAPDSVVQLGHGMAMPLRYAKCCRPDSGVRGPLEGVISRLGEVKIHKSHCRMLRNVNPGRRISAKWR
jgi:(p)ppGpp synthase/HD superfamily hydrolase